VFLREGVCRFNLTVIYFLTLLIPGSLLKATWEQLKRIKREKKGSK
jgi:hypothetical protein